MAGLSYRASDLSTEAADLEYLALGQGPEQDQGTDQGLEAGGVNSLQW